METLSTLLNYTFYAFTLLAILLFIGYWIVPTYRPTISKLIKLSYIYLLITSLIYLGQSIFQFITYLGENDEWEQYAFTNRLFGPFWFAYWGALFCKGFIPQILWIKKIRQNIWTAIILVPFLLFNFYIPWLYLLSTDSPSSIGIINLDFTKVFIFFIISTILLVVSFFIIEKKVINK
jgi:hypothetical protein